VDAETATRIRKDVAMRDGSCQATRNMTVPLAPNEWHALGVRLTSGKPLPKSEVPMSLVSGSTRHFLVTGNYDAILEYNCSHSYAITVALLGDAIASTAKVKAAPAAKTKPHARPPKRG
jgi:membrane-bound lytic murein transglycosylase B